MDCGCGCGRATPTGPVQLYACSGTGNVGEIADLAARAMMADGVGKLHCLAGLGAKEPDKVRKAKDARLNVVIDGCATDCAKKILDSAGIFNYVHLRVTDQGIEKVKGAKPTPRQVALVAAKAKESAK